MKKLLLRLVEGKQYFKSGVMQYITKKKNKKKNVIYTEFSEAVKIVNFHLKNFEYDMSLSVAVLTSTHSLYVLDQK